ncbi:GmrSD restriction endonuclease domain-containing protein [Bizionia myxarmorum]|uniref:DUF262 domain-containing protein n=1 Tax=Bizionia myxarmorum TaxID=291186 RepID=A0A5D0RDW7_9FLAO|nr:DUF262 domain-containing protein [Bizionia myxarmorum]TYB79176.1 DUF262 domain-containing protein [Bizionia myxarmorum]
METLASTLKNYKIEIPVIQRDYVQGREDAKAHQIREQFVKDLLDNLISDKNDLHHLDFIYGRIIDDLNTDSLKKNAESVEQLLSILRKYHTSLDVKLSGELPVVDRKELIALNKKFLPLDGQQRLTTLWLLHFVIAHQLDYMPEWMMNFTYKTRKSSRDFCATLLKHNCNLIICESYAEVIQNQPWFFYKWKNDPTVKGMLVMLDEIWKQITSITNWDDSIKSWWDALTGDNNKICFSFLPLDEHNIDDEIYIKMNARGKQLSDFEIFKNSLLEFLEECLINHPETLTKNDIAEYAHKLDTTWLDIFWGVKRKGIFDIQENYFNFFKLSILYTYIEKQNIKENDKNKGIDADVIKLYLKNTNESSKYESLSFQQMKSKSLITLESVIETFKLLEIFEDRAYIDRFIEWLQDEKFIFDETGFINHENALDSLLFSHFNESSQKIAYYDRTFYIAIISFIKRNRFNQENLEISFKRYARLCYNLVYNQNYIQSPETFGQAILSVIELSKVGNKLYENPKLLRSDTIKFKQNSIEEEILKLDLIRINASYEKEFIKFERHPYFKGQIGFVVKMSGDLEFFDIERFIDYREKLLFLFSSEMNTSDQKLFDRALLTYSNYFISQGHSRWMFCDSNTNFRLKEERWRIVFANNRDNLKKLLDRLDIANMEKSLKEIIKQYNGSSWRKYFIESPELWKACNNRTFKKTDDGYKVRLLKNENAGGTQRELRSKFFEINYKMSGKSILPFESLKYDDVTKQEEEPCAFFDNWKYKGMTYFMDIRYINREYELRFSFREQQGLRFDNYIIEILNSCGYYLSEKYIEPAYLKNIVSDADLEIHVDGLLNKFTELNNSI